MDQPIFILQSIPPSGHVAESDSFFAGNLLSPLTAEWKTENENAENIFSSFSSSW